MQDLDLSLSVELDAPDQLRVDYRLRSAADRRCWVFDRGLTLPALPTAWPNINDTALLLFAGVVPSPPGVHAVRPCRPFASMLEPGAELEASLHLPLPVAESGPYQGWSADVPHELHELTRVELAIDVDFDDPALELSPIGADAGAWSVIDPRPGRWPLRVGASARCSVPIEVARRTDHFARIRL